jgi:hypothetical protein
VAVGIFHGKPFLRHAGPHVAESGYPPQLIQFMRNSQRVALAMAAICATACLGTAVRRAEAQQSVGEEDFGFFHDSLAPYGDWMNVAGHGACWKPDVGSDWAPYTDGYWAYTDVGWTWVSHEPFGSIVYHYGRWLLTSRGWCWVPGPDWSPAWVSWRTGEDYIGWAPLPPEVPWHPNRGISTWVDVHTEIGPAYYRFCSVRDFASPVLAGVLLRPSRNVSIMLRTENVTYITVRNSSIFCGGPRYDWVSASVFGEVPLLRVAREENVRHYRSIQGVGGGVQNFVYNNILVLPAPRRVECASATRNISAPTVKLSFSKGWFSDSSGNSERLKTHIGREWEQRGGAPSQPDLHRNFGGPTTRLTAPTTAEKRAALNELAASPLPPQPAVPKNRSVPFNTSGSKSAEFGGGEGFTGSGGNGFKNGKPSSPGRPDGGFSSGGTVGAAPVPPPAIPSGSSSRSASGGFPGSGSSSQHPSNPLGQKGTSPFPSNPTSKTVPIEGSPRSGSGTVPPVSTPEPPPGAFPRSASGGFPGTAPNVQNPRNPVGQKGTYPSSSIPTSNTAPVDRSARSGYGNVPRETDAIPKAVGTGVASGNSKSISTNGFVPGNGAGKTEGVGKSNGFGTTGAAAPPSGSNGGFARGPGYGDTGLNSGRPSTTPPEPLSGFGQPQANRAGTGSPKTVPSNASGVSSKSGSFQDGPFGNTARGGIAPVPAAPMPRSPQPNTVVDQPSRYPRSGSSFSTPPPSAPAASTGMGASGIPGGNRPKSVAPPSPIPAPASAPASSAGSTQKKKPGDPGYVPGSP